MLTFYNGFWHNKYIVNCDNYFKCVKIKRGKSIMETRLAYRKNAATAHESEFYTWGGV